MEKIISTSIRLLLASLPKGSFQFQGHMDQVIESVTWDYQKVKKNSLYFCVEQEEFQENHIRTNSLEYWENAVQAGAVCLVTEKDRIKNLPEGISLLEVDHLNGFMAVLSRAFYGDPLADMKIVGITGTNGKTTTSQLIDSILTHAGNKTGVIGTIGTFYPSGKQEASHLSNPMATELFSIGRQMKDENVKCLSMEVTSHAMAFDRNEAIDFDVAVFTNLTQDHLDYHKTIESYKKCKLKHFHRLGTGKKPAFGIVNIDDTSGREFADAVAPELALSGKVKIVTYGVRNKDADLVAIINQMTGSYSEFDILFKGNHLCKVFLPMAGLFNVYNSLAAFGTAYVLGISVERIVEGLKGARKVDGRFERVDCTADFEVYVDYAHTPDSLEKILQEIRRITKKRVIVVFGCGGDRDRSKRPEMGKIAANLADVYIITSDNPRSEDPEAIIKDILDGVPFGTGSKCVVEPDRRQGIYKALEMASEGDAVLIAGKGHEDYQIIGKKRLKFLDRGVVYDFFQQRKSQYSRAWIEIQTNALRDNFKLIFEDKPDHLKILAVVKDDALGHGIIESAREAINAGCCYIGVACLSEAVKVREAFHGTPILVFGERFDHEITTCVRYDLTLQVQSREKVEYIAKISRQQQKTTRVHLKVDSGMGRYGVRWDRAVEEYKSIRQIQGIDLEGIMTHFAQSDESSKEYADRQWQRFNDVLTILRDESIEPKLIHACNSGGFLDLPHAHGNMVRLGILPCGVYPSKVCRRININGRQLEPVMRVATRISFFKTLQPGDSVGYGMHFIAEKETRVAVLPFGYGDGYPRLRNKGYVLICGQEAPIVGGNGMDATMVDVSEILEAIEGSEVVLLGKQGEREITAMSLADWAGTVTYDILSRWSSRMERYYKV
ncbi:UDP-N-acetylmuramoyl-L-alanyl-D-glutamate--2,6-diaminopimelate ligase [bacterium]|nr:UDP-N-acetylmuramoyl-L-alanyl-D-glutamate--2,6-diaminopimelate ligase [bacterium]